MKNRRKFLIGFVGCCFLLLYQGCSNGYDILDEYIEEKPLVTSLAQEDPVYQTPIADRIYAFGSSLTNRQKKLLDNALDTIIKKHPVFRMMYEKLCAEGGIKFEINPNLLIPQKANAGYLDRTIMFLNEGCITDENLKEELIHAIQDIYIYGKYYMDQARKNVEFEAKVLRDLLTVNSGDGGPLVGNIGMDKPGDEQYNGKYNSLIHDFKSLLLSGDFWEKFHSLCILWRGYGGNWLESFQPRTIMKYADRICLN